MLVGSKHQTRPLEYVKGKKTDLTPLDQQRLTNLAKSYAYASAASKTAIMQAGKTDPAKMEQMLRSDPEFRALAEKALGGKVVMDAKNDGNFQIQQPGHLRRRRLPVLRPSPQLKQQFQQMGARMQINRELNQFVKNLTGGAGTQGANSVANQMKDQTRELAKTLMDSSIPTGQKVFAVLEFLGEAGQLAQQALQDQQQNQRLENLSSLMRRLFTSTSQPTASGNGWAMPYPAGYKC